MKPIPKLKKNDIIIALEDIIIPDTGSTFYIYKGNSYKITEFLDLWKENAWRIKLGSNNFQNQGWFTENELFQKFNCLKIQRQKKLKKLSKIK